MKSLTLTFLLILTFVFGVYAEEICGSNSPEFDSFDEQSQIFQINAGEDAKNMANVDVKLKKAMTWEGENYQPGTNSLPKKAADYAHRRGFCDHPPDTKEAENPPPPNDPNDPLPPNDPNDDLNGLPEDFPNKAVFESLGYKSVEEIQALSLEALIDLKGIGAVSAKAALDYGK